MDGLKLDNFLADNMWTERGEVILNSLIQTGHQLGLIILAERIETEEQVKKLRQYHCDILQGFYFSLPVPLEEARRKIEEHCTT